MKDIKLILIFLLISIVSFGQGITVRTQPNTPTIGGSTYNKGVIQDANLKIALTLGIPYGTSYTLNNANPEAGKLFYNTSTNKLGVFNGASWEDVGGSAYSFSNLFSVSGNNVTIDTTKIRTVLNSWTKAQSDSRYLKILDGVKRLDSIRVSGMNVILYSPVQWLINGINYSKLTNTTISINAASGSNNRIDLLYATTSSAILKTQGVESSGIAIEPTLPNGTVKVALVYVNGANIQQPIPELAMYVTRPELTDSLRNYANITRTNTFLYHQRIQNPVNTSFINLGFDNEGMPGGQYSYIDLGGGYSAIRFNTPTSSYQITAAGDNTLDISNVATGRSIRFDGNTIQTDDGIYFAKITDINAAIGVTINSSANPLALSDRGYYNYTGSVNATWNLPSSPPVGRFYRIYNKASAAVTLTVATLGGITFYRGGTTSGTIDLMQGENLTIQYDGINFNVYGN